MNKVRELIKIKDLYVCNLINGKKEKIIVIKKTYDMNYTSKQRFTSIYYEAFSQSFIAMYTGENEIDENEHEDVMCNFQRLEDSFFTEKELNFGYIEKEELEKIYLKINDENKKRIKV